MIETHALQVPGQSRDDPLALRELAAQPADDRYPPILLLHGATLCSRLFDLPRAGYSLMRELAAPGRRVYGLDLRGYGASGDCTALREPPESGPPCTRAEDAEQDIAAAVDFILRRNGVAALDLIGFSWGTITAARYAGAFPQRVARLVLYAPLYGEANRGWLDRIADPRDPARLNPAFGAYRLVTLAELVLRWNTDLPPGDPARYRDAGVPELVFETIAALDPEALSRSPPAFRCPNGALADLVRVFNGNPLFAPEKLTMPTLLVRGADDTTSTDSDTLRLMARIAAAEKQYRVIDPGSHFLCAEKSRATLYACLDEFLKPSTPQGH